MLQKALNAAPAELLGQVAPSEPKQGPSTSEPTVIPSSLILDTIEEPDEDDIQSEKEDEDGVASSSTPRPRVLVSVSSAVRLRDTSGPSSSRSSSSFQADAFEVLLGKEETAIQSRPSKPLMKSLGFAGVVRHGRLFARAVSNLISRDFSPAPPAVLSSLSRKRPREEPAEKIDVPDSIEPPDMIKFATSYEVLANKGGRKRKRPRTKLPSTSHPDMDEAGAVAQPLFPQSKTPTKKTRVGKKKALKSAEEAPTHAKSPGSGDGPLQKDVLSEALKETPNRQWKRKKAVENAAEQTSSSAGDNSANSSKKSRKSVISGAVLENAKDILPAAFMSQQQAAICSNHGLSTMATPKFYGSSAVKPAKQKTAAPTKKKRKK